MLLTMEYDKWTNFQSVILKAKTACELSRHKINNHFADVGKMVSLGSGSQRNVKDIMLTRYACYLIAQNGDPRKLLRSQIVTSNPQTHLLTIET